MKELNNAATRPGATNPERKRIPMSVPVQRLEAPSIPGYHLHWFNGTEERLARAQAAGYEFVNADEVKVNSVGLGNESTQSGNTDLGSQVSVVAGSEIGRDGQPMRMILMKIKQEWYEEDQKLVDARSAQVANALTGGMLGSEKDAAGDSRQRYLDKARTALPDLFNPNKRRVQVAS